MASGQRTHSVTVETSEPVPGEIGAGNDLVLKVRVTCAQGCDLRGMPVTLTAPDSAAATGELASFAAGANETADLTVKAPQQVGEHVVRVSFASVRCTADPGPPRHDLWRCRVCTAPLRSLRSLVLRRARDTTE